MVGFAVMQDRAVSDRLRRLREAIHEAARVHHTSRRRVATRGARADATTVELDAPALEDIAMRFSSTLAVASTSMALLMCGPGGTAISQAATPRTPVPAHHCPGCAVDCFQSAWRIHDLGGSERNGQSNQMDK